jgi:hypothetical protein
VTSDPEYTYRRCAASIVVQTASTDAHTTVSLGTESTRAAQDLLSSVRTDVCTCVVSVWHTYHVMIYQCSYHVVTRH